MLRTIRTHRAAPYIAVLLSLTTTIMTCSPASAGLPRLREAAPINWNRALPEGLREALTPEQLSAALNRSTHPAKQPDVRPLTAAEMKSYRGSGPLRNQYFCGALPWQRSLRDVNLCNGNLFKSFTDIQVSPAHGAGLALQRTYNSDDDRIGPFGTGWTHAYDIRMQESATANYSDRVDFFGARHAYHRDADGLYSPPPYLFDELNSDYNSFLVNGPTSVMDDTDIGMDGTIKHYIADNNSRACDYIQDRFGNRTTLAYNLNVTMPDGSQQNVLTSVTDPSGRSLTFNWTNIGTQQQPVWRITQVQGPQYTVNYAYGSDANLSSVTLDPGGVNRVTNYTYTTYATETGLLASITDGLSHSVSYTYFNPNPNPTSTLWVGTVTEPGSGGSHIWTISPGSWQGVNPNYTFLTYVNDNDANHTISFSTDTDTYLRCISTEIGPTPLYQATYDSSNNVLETEQPSNGMYLYNSNIHLLNSGEDCTYGPHGNVLTQHPFGFGSQVTTTTYYDASGYFQKASVTDPLGHVTSFGVGLDNDPNIGNRGNVLYVRDALYNYSHKQFTYTYNSYGQKISETNENGTVTNYTYGDQWGNLTEIVQDPGGGHLNRTTSMGYDVAGHVLTSVDNNGQTDTFIYNHLGQPASASFPATAGAPAETISYSYGGNGRTSSVTDNRGTTTMNYETGNDRVSSVVDPVTGMTSYTYGLAGQRNSMTLPGGGTWNYAYITGGGYGGTGEVHPKDQPDSVAPRLVSITDDQNRLVNYQMDLRGVTHEIYSNQIFNGQGVLQSYNWTGITEDASGSTHGWTAEIQNQYWWLNNQVWNSRNLTQNVYSYDNNGMRLTNTVTIGNNAARTETYGYDALERLTSVNYGDGQTQSYTFDPMSNRTQKVDSVNGTENSTCNLANMILTRGSGNSYTYDSNGNTLTGGGRTNTWDSENRMVKSIMGSNTSTYKYAADGLRHQGTVNGTVTNSCYDADMFVREMDHNLSPTATYLAGPIGPMYRRDDVAGTVRWYCYDALGSVLAEVDPSGNTTASRAFDVYGSVRNSTGTSTSKHKFVGQLGHTSDDETGLIYMRARYMDPATGTFVSEDPGRNGSNWFSYCDGNPVCRYDQTGNRWSQKEIDWLNSILQGLGEDLIVGGAAAFVAALIAFETAKLWGGASKTGQGFAIAGRISLLAGAGMVFAGALILALSWYLLGVKGDDEIDDAQPIAEEMLATAFQLADLTGL